MTIVVSFISNFKPQLMHGISRFLVMVISVGVGLGVGVGLDVEVGLGVGVGGICVGTVGVAVAVCGNVTTVVPGARFASKYIVVVAKTTTSSRAIHAINCQR